VVGLVTDSPRSWIADVATDIVGKLRAAGFDNTHAQIIKLQEECGELAGAYLRAAGLARRQGTAEERDAELADVAITCFVIAEYLGVDLDAAIARKLGVINARGWRERGESHV
jgi:NTP pyrophosphatase (non-canonical NTP hydrolase)